MHAVQELGKDYDTIMVNCNPETVSTDYDMSDRLYFEPLTFEDVLEIYEAEKKMGPVKGVIVQLGGQTPLSLAARLEGRRRADSRHHPESIDLAENRELFGEVLKKAGMGAPRYGTAPALKRPRRMRKPPTASVTRCSCARATCSAAVVWKSSTTTSSSTRSVYVS